MMTRRAAALVFTLLVILGEIIALGVLIARAVRVSEAAADAEMTWAGRTYIETLESRDVDAVQEEVLLQHKERMAEEREETRQALLDGTADVWSFFGDAVIMGDSRAVGFYVYDFLPEDRVLAGAGYTIRNILDDLETLKQIDPAELFLCYGLNDISIGFWTEPEQYCDEYLETLNTLRDALPNTDIYVNSTIPATETGIARESLWANIPDWNVYLKQMCDDNGFGWVDCSDIAEEYSYLYDVDGVHLQYEFYPCWAAEMITAACEYADNAALAAEAEE